METRNYLASSQLIGCDGRVTHTLVLLPDGTVEVTMGSVRAVVDPGAAKVLRPFGVQVPDAVLTHAATLAREGIG